MRGAPTSPRDPEVVPLSVVLTNLDGAAWLEGCLRSIAEGTRRPAEVIVSDDGSTDASAEVAARHGARFVAGGPRSGWSATSNRGLAAATQPWIFLLNNDVELAPDAIEALGRAAEEHPDAAFLSPLVRSLRDRRTIDSAGLVLYPDGAARPRWHGLAEPPEPLRDEEILLPSGAALVIRRDWLERIGGFDHDFRWYCEDLDWGLRSARMGGRGRFVPGAVVYHHFSGSFGALSPRKARYVERNRVTVAVRHLPPRMLLASPFWTLRRWLALSRTVTVAAGEDRTASRTRIALAALGGLGEGVLRLPQSLRERRALARMAAVDGSRLAMLLTRFRGSTADMRRFGARSSAV
jgi:GT2 family glycosyltransferase